MPKIPDQIQVGVPRSSRAVIAPAGVDNSGLNSVVALGRGIAADQKRKADLEENKQDRIAYAKGKSALIAAQNEVVDGIDDDDFSTYGERFDEAFNKRAEEAGSAITSDYDKELFEIEKEEAYRRGKDKLNTRAQSKERDFGISTLNEVLDQNRTAALESDDDDRREYIKSTMDAIEGAREKGYISAVQAQDARRKWTKDFSIASIELEPADQREAAVNGELGAFIDEDIKQSIITKANREVEIATKRAQIVAQKDLSVRIKDSTAAYLQGKIPGDAPDEEDFIEAYGEDAQARFSEFKEFESLGSDINALATLPTDQARTLLLDRQPVPGEGYAADLQRYNTLVVAAQNLEKQKQSDPVQYISEHTDIDPSDRASLVAEQERLGVRQPKLLADSQASEIARQFSNVEDGGQNSAELIEGLEGEYGDDWPTVFRQLSSKLPPAALVIGAGVDPQVANTLARIAHTPTKELKAGLETVEASDAKRNVLEAMTDFRKTLAPQVGGERVFSTVAGEAERLAYTYMAAGADSSEAAERAYAEVVGSKYEFAETYRVPAEYDFDQIEDNLDDIVSINDFELPGESQFSESFVQSRKQELIDNSYWVTSPNEDGLVLYHNGSEVPGVSFTFEEILARENVRNGAADLVRQTRGRF